MRIAVVCMGNICRSPIGEYVLKGEANKQGIDLEVCSGGTGDWHIGQSAHPNSVEVLHDEGYDASGHRARQFTSDWFDDHDLILVMDHQNERAVLQLARNQTDRDKVKLMRSFDPEASDQAEVADPYGLPKTAYIDVLQQVRNAVNGLLNQIIV